MPFFSFNYTSFHICNCQMVNSNMATNTYTLTLDPDGGFIKYTTVEQDARRPEETISVVKYTTKPLVLDATIGETVVGFPSDEDVKRPGHGFHGWYRTFPGFHSSSAEKQTQITSDTTWNWERDLTFTARWEPQDCTITWDGNGGTWDQTKQRTVPEIPYGTIAGSMDEFNKELPTLSEHDFLGWFTHPKHGNQISEYSQVDGNRTYYAHWRIIRHRVRFLSRETVVSSVECPHGEVLGELP